MLRFVPKAAESKPIYAASCKTDSREFTYKGVAFHLNDNRAGIAKSNRALFPKYALMVFDEYFGAWVKLTCVASKREALDYVKSNYLYLFC